VFEDYAQLILSSECGSDDERHLPTGKRVSSFPGGWDARNRLALASSQEA
jgi:hypothetical protein